MPKPDELVESYLDEVAGLLPRWADTTDIVDELRDGLGEAIETEGARGLAPPAAAHAAIQGFGPPEHVAAAHTRELAVRCSRRHAWLVVGLLVGAALLWYVGYERSLGVPESAIPRGRARELFLLAATMIQYVPLMAALGIATHLLASRRLIPGCRRRGAYSPVSASRWPLRRCARSYSPPPSYSPPAARSSGPLPAPDSPRSSSPSRRAR